MDKFTKYALMAMVAIVGSMLVTTYVGYTLFGSSIFNTRYITVMEEQAKQLGVTLHHPIELGVEGEYIGFTIAGAIAGFIIGYLFTAVFETKGEK